MTLHLPHPQYFNRPEKIESMFYILINKQPMQTKDGKIYEFKTSKEAVRVVYICYGLSALNKFVKIKKK